MKEDRIFTAKEILWDFVLYTNLIAFSLVLRRILFRFILRSSRSLKVKHILNEVFKCRHDFTEIFIFLVHNTKLMNMDVMSANVELSALCPV
jgi:hypothetical protein